MAGATSTMPRNIKTAPSPTTVVRLKVLEVIVENVDPYQESLAHAICACGSGGGCSGGDRRTVRA